MVSGEPSQRGSTVAYQPAGRAGTACRRATFAAIWTKLGHRQPATPLKFAAGTMTMGLAFLLFLPFVGAVPTRLHCWR